MSRSRIRARALWLVLLLPALVGAAGCGADKGTVTGTVVGYNPWTRQMQPVIAGQLRFHNVETHAEVTAEIQPDGTYEAVGVPVGSVVVVVELPHQDNDDEETMELPPQERQKYIPLPEVYASIDETPLKLDVQKGTQSFPIELRPPAQE